MVGGLVVIGVLFLVSVIWFVLYERIIVIVIGILVGYFGIVVVFVVGLVMVFNEVVKVNVSNLLFLKYVDYEIIKYIYFEFGLCFVVFLCVFVYFLVRLFVFFSFIFGMLYMFSIMVLVK